MEGKYRPRVLALMTKDVKGKPHVLAVKNTANTVSSPYNFPGGGTEGQPLIRAAKREALEEVGYNLNRAKVIQEPKEYTLSSSWRDYIKGRRGINAVGIKQSIVHGQVGKKNMRLYNSEGDGIKDIKLYPLDEVINSMDKFTSKHEKTDPNNLHPFVVANRDIVNALSSIQKKASAPRDYRKEYLRDHASPEAKANRAKRNYWNRKIKTPPGKELDHKIPLSKGGSNNRSNIRVATVSENRSKGTKVAGYAHLYNQVDRHALNAYMAAKRREAALSYAKSEQERMDGIRRRVSNIDLRRLRKYGKE